MLPDRCSVIKSKKQCPNPPEFIISILDNKDEYMVGVTCNFHKKTITNKLIILQNQKHIPPGKIQFTKITSVGTDCIKGDLIDIM